MARGLDYQKGLEALAEMLESENWDREEELAAAYGYERCRMERKLAVTSEDLENYLN